MRKPRRRFREKAMVVIYKACTRAAWDNFSDLYASLGPDGPRIPRGGDDIRRAFWRGFKTPLIKGRYSTNAIAYAAWAAGVDFKKMRARTVDRSETA